MTGGACTTRACTRGLAQPGPACNQAACTAGVTGASTTCVCCHRTRRIGLRHRRCPVAGTATTVGGAGGIIGAAVLLARKPTTVANPAPTITNSVANTTGTGRRYQADVSGPRDLQPPRHPPAQR